MGDIRYDDLLDLEEEDFDTVLAEDIEFTGTIKFKQPFMIKGKVSGEIYADSDLSIEESAVIQGNIKASRVLVKGTVTGNITADSIVHIFPCGSLTGDISAPDVILEKGCFFKGNCAMQGQA